MTMSTHTEFAAAHLNVIIIHNIRSAIHLDLDLDILHKNWLNN